MAQAATIDVLVSAIYDLQLQVYNLTANRSRESSFGGYGPYACYGRHAGAGPSSASPFYGMSGYGAMTLAPSTFAIIVHSTATSQPVPITHIQFPSSPSPIPGFSGPPPCFPTAPAHGFQPPQMGHHEDDAEGLGVPRYYKLSFPTFDGREDPLGWLHRCEHFFRAQRTGEVGKVGLASFHMTGAAQQCYYMLERDEACRHGRTSKPSANNASGRPWASTTWRISRVSPSGPPSTSTSSPSRPGWRTPAL
jgi:hypothetical protein